MLVSDTERHEMFMYGWADYRVKARAALLRGWKSRAWAAARRAGRMLARAHTVNLRLGLSKCRQCGATTSGNPCSNCGYHK